MKMVARLLIGSILAFLACHDEEYNLNGTILKQISLEGPNRKIYSRVSFIYDDSGNLIKMDSYLPGFNYDYDITIEYQDGKVSRVNNDSLVYEDDVLRKTFFVFEDTTVISSEFEIENDRLVGKKYYTIESDYNTNHHIVTDTTYFQFEYDAAGNIKKTTPGKPLIQVELAAPNIYGVGSPSEFEYDSKVSPLAGIALELKWMLLYNPGPNNIIKRTSPNYRDPGAEPYTSEAKLEYNQDNCPIRASFAGNPSDLFVSYKYY